MVQGSFNGTPFKPIMPVHANEANIVDVTSRLHLKPQN